MCHIRTKEFKKAGENGLTVYKAAVESMDTNDFSFDSFPLSIWCDRINPVYTHNVKYNTIFTNSEIRLNKLMRDHCTCDYSEEDENIGPGFYHFFKTKEEATSFIEKIAIRCNFQKGERLCILVGNIPEGEMYNEGMFIFEDILYSSIISKVVYYTGEIYYEGEF